MDFSDECVHLVKRFEGLKLKAYKCPAGIWTIGYGATGPDVYEGLEWTLEQAEDRLLRDLGKARDHVLRVVRVPLTQGQLDALTSFFFNLGPKQEKDCKLLRYLNQGEYELAANEFPRWIWSKGKQLPGLIERRKAERDLFLS